MKKILVIFVLFFLYSAIPAHAQSPDVQAESDYRYQFDLYRTAYTKYQVDKSEYLKSGTLKAEQEALESAKAACLARADVWRTYAQWLRLQLLNYQAYYPQSTNLADRLEKVQQTYLDHKAKINAAATKDAFDLVDKDYQDGLLLRERLYTQSQIELKLAKLAYFRQEMLRLLTPIRPKLETQLSVVEVEQGLSRADENFTEIDTKINGISQTAKALEDTGRKAQKNDPEEVRYLATKELELLRQLSLKTVTILSELESRYGQQ